MNILKVDDLKKTYVSRLGTNRVDALKGVFFSVEEGEYVAIMGESGSGKTTLLNILAALDKPTGGSVLLKGKNVVDIKESDMAVFRRDNLGYVFQDFNLIDSFSIRDTPPADHIQNKAHSLDRISMLQEQLSNDW